jgi:anti-sigma factor RsiW
MDCRKYRRLVMTTRSDDRTPDEARLVATHAAECADCASLGAEVAGLEQVLRATPTVGAPDGFTARVMARVEQMEEPSRPGLLARLLSALKVPAPSFSFAQVAAAGVLIIVLGVAGGYLAHHSAPAGIANPAGVEVAQQGLDSEAMDELLVRHEGASSAQPLSDDQGMRLVSLP